MSRLKRALMPYVSTAGKSRDLARMLWLHLAIALTSRDREGGARTRRAVIGRLKTLVTSGDLHEQWEHWPFEAVLADV